jgi:hypothetical protein
MLVFIVLPRLETAVEGQMLMMGVAVVPSFLNTFNVDTKRVQDESASSSSLTTNCDDDEDSSAGKTCLKVFKKTLDILAFLSQLSILLLWPVLMLTQASTSSYDPYLIWGIPCSLFLASFMWWENFIGEDTHLGKLNKKILALKKEIRKAKTKTYLLVSFWKICIAFVCLILMVGHPTGDIKKAVFDFTSVTNCGSDKTSDILESNYDWIYVWLVNTGSSLVCYLCARSAAKILIQIQSYALPLLLATPGVFGLLVGWCSAWNNDRCSFDGFIPTSTFFDCVDVSKTLVSTQNNILQFNILKI